ncbi:MAG: RcpC/CpaB family pilus assembly protein, partial [Kiritimatiellaeota bacterium]|nr:RcpC/CpaB family pilus assembly protein [Kiritimatiellota bacterium]
VLATGMETAKSVASGGHHAGGYSTVTLEVTPREAEVLVFAQQMKGRLSLTLRNPSDIYYEKETPRIDFQKIEGELKSLNDYRQATLRGGKLQ